MKNFGESPGIGRAPTTTLQNLRNRARKVSSRTAMRTLAVIVLCLVVGAGCTRPNPTNCLDGVCSDPAYPFCDVDGLLEEQPNTCIAVECEPSDVVACRGSSALTCNATGNNYDLVSCSAGCDPEQGCLVCTPNTTTCDGDTLRVCDAAGASTATTCVGGCVTEGGPHCSYLEPLYLPDVCDAQADEPSVVVSSDQPFDTTIDALCTGGIVAQQVGPEICVVRARTIMLASSATWTVTGTRALALVADDLLAIDGRLDVSANATINGPGGGTLVSGGAGRGEGSGGAGFTQSGGDGGSHTADGGADNGGFNLQDSEIVTLVGGPRSDGRLRAGDDPFEAMPGGAGGALALIACRGTVTVSGLIDAGGGGGAGGVMAPPPQFEMGGGGGGAGGHVALQGFDVFVGGRVFANGGAGGSGLPLGGVAGTPGFDGPTDVYFASPGQQQGMEGVGGAGGYAGGLPRPGKRSTEAQNGPGGGGGSAGRLEVFTPQGATPAITPTAASPEFEPNRVIPTR